MKRCFSAALLAISALGISQKSADAALSATATISAQQVSANSYTYSMTLTNNGDTNIGTFWFAWFPAYDLLPTAPTAIGSPAGWTGVNAPDIFGVASAQWVNTTTPLQPNHSLSGFTFTTSDSPATLAGTSFFSVPIMESYVYIGAPETDPGFALVPAAVAAPEPGSLMALVGAPLALLTRRRRR